MLSHRMSMAGSEVELEYVAIRGPKADLLDRTTAQWELVFGQDTATVRVSFLAVYRACPWVHMPLKPPPSSLPSCPRPLPYLTGSTRVLASCCVGRSATSDVHLQGWHGCVRRNTHVARNPVSAVPWGPVLVDTRLGRRRT